MPTDTPWLADTVRLCRESRLYVQLLQHSIFVHISAQMTAAQYTAAEHNIRALGEQIATTIDWSHYGSLSGTHMCVRDVSELAVAYLANLRIWAVEPPAPPAPPPRTQPSRSADAVVNDASSLADAVKQPGDTYLGEVRPDDPTLGGTK